MKIKGLPDEERPREKLLYQGKETLNNAELLAILLRTGTREKSAIELAHELLAIGDEGIRSLSECTPEELAEISGMGKAKICQVLAAIELGKRVASYQKKDRVTVGKPDDIVQIFMEKMRYYTEEHFCMLLLDTKGKVIEEKEISVGDLSSAPVHPREVFKQAIRRNASAAALVHNHPSGDPTPSIDDIDVTERLISVAEIIGITIVDHVIIGDGTYCSMKSDGLI